MTIDEQSYLLAKAAKVAWYEANGDIEGAVSLLSDKMANDPILRGYIASIAIAEISFDEFDNQIGPAVGRA